MRFKYALVKVPAGITYHTQVFAQSQMKTLFTAAQRGAGLRESIRDADPLRD